MGCTSQLQPGTASSVSCSLRFSGLRFLMWRLRGAQEASPHPLLVVFISEFCHCWLGPFKTGAEASKYPLGYNPPSFLILYGQATGVKSESLVLLAVSKISLPALLGRVAGEAFSVGPVGGGRCGLCLTRNVPLSLPQHTPGFREGSPRGCSDATNTSSLLVSGRGVFGLLSWKGT